MQVLYDFNDVTFAFDDVLSRKEKVQKMWWKYVRFTFVDVLSKVLLCKRFKQFQWCYICIWWCAIKKKKITENVGKYLVTEETKETPKTTCTGNQSWACGKHFATKAD